MSLITRVIRHHKCAGQQRIPDDFRTRWVGGGNFARWGLVPKDGATLEHLEVIQFTWGIEF